nr:MAG: hypothetical protein [Bacteriophage sp.]
MNEPIISPWLIYWAGRIELIQVVCCVVGLVVTAFAVTAAMAVLTDDYEHDESVRALKILVCAAFILDTLAVFLPTKTEIFAMYAAERITPAAIKATGEFTGKTVDALIEKILKASKTVKE